MLASIARQTARPVLNTARCASTTAQQEIPELLAFLKGSVPKEHTAPILKFGYNGRLASALFSEAIANGQLDKAEKDFVSVTNVLFSTEDNKAMLTHGMMKKPLGDLLEKSFKKDKTLDAVADTFVELWETNNMIACKDVLAEFQELLVAHRGEVPANVVTAQELSPAQLKSLTKSLTDSLEDGEKLVLTTEVNPAILGGMVIRLGDKFLDHSVRSRIQNYTGTLKAAQLTGPSAATSLSS